MRRSASGATSTEGTGRNLIKGFLTIASIQISPAPSIPLTRRCLIEVAIRFIAIETAIMYRNNVHYQEPISDCGQRN